MKRGRKNKQTHGSFKEGELLKVCGLLNKEGAKYIVIGAMAAGLHGLIRATRDIDVLIPKDATNAEKVLKALSHLTFGMAIELDSEEVAKKAFTIIGDIPRVDLITVAMGVTYEKAEKRALETVIDHTRIPYVDYETLVKTKQTGRLQDRADLERLAQIHEKEKS